MKKIIFMGLMTTLSCRIKIHGAANLPLQFITLDTEDPSSKIVKIVSSKTKVPYLFFEEIHKKIVELCTLLGETKKLRLETETTILCYLCNFLLTYPKEYQKQDTKIGLLLDKITKFVADKLPPSPDIPDIEKILIDYTLYFFEDDENIRLAENVAECIQIILYNAGNNFYWYNLIETLEYNKEIVIYTPQSPFSSLKQGSSRIRSTFSNSPVSSSGNESDDKIKRHSSMPTTPTIEHGLSLKQHHLDRIDRSPDCDGDFTHNPPKHGYSSPLTRISPVKKVAPLEIHQPKSSQSNSTKVTIMECLMEKKYPQEL
ncbi:hypothetical protein IPF37_02040 [bacterium]|nr:MAG: hypothetical protein IPF37_02040 [bacterium]